MVAVVHCCKGFHRPVNYNEQKVKERAAVLLDACNYPKRAYELTFAQKLGLLQKRAQLNEKTTVNCLHISLNFDPSERFDEDKLRMIAAAYMEQIGFGEQPYLLYRHDDAGHPHVHIVATNIKADGSRISLHNIGKVTSENARKEVEKMFALLRPEDSKNRRQYDLKPVNAQKVAYGKTATKRAITAVLNKVLPEYKYASLAELNAVSKQYNIVADRGSTDSRVYQKGGLVYRVLDENGNKVGVPVKASDIYGQPTLKHIEQRCEANETYRQSYKTRVRNAIDWTLMKTSQMSLEQFAEALKNQGIHVVVRQNDNGVVYGLTYVDHQTKCVFNGSDLGKQYAAKAILERCEGSSKGQQKTNVNKLTSPLKDDGTYPATMPVIGGNGLAEALLQQEFTGETIPFELRKRKKKKRKNISDN